MWIADIERTHKIIAWVKENQNSRNYIGKTSGFNVWEPVLVYGKAKKCVARDSFSIPIGIQVAADGHPCPKSLEAWSRLVEDFTEHGDLIADPFMGAGTTIIAAEQLSRCAYGLEISPAYCDLTVRRWENLTGHTATREGAKVVA
jgi:DNA modification methylase